MMLDSNLVSLYRCVAGHIFIFIFMIWFFPVVLGYCQMTESSAWNKHNITDVNFTVQIIGNQD